MTAPRIPAAPNDYEQILDQDQAAAPSAMQQSMYVASKRPSPDRWGQVLALSKKNGLPTDVVDRNFDALSQHDQQTTPDYTRLSTDTPGLAKWLQDPDNATIGHKELPQLSQVDRGARLIAAPTQEPLGPLHAARQAISTGWNDLGASTGQLAAAFGILDPRKAAEMVATHNAQANALRAQMPDYATEYNKVMAEKGHNFDAAVHSFFGNQDALRRGDVLDALKGYATGAIHTVGAALDAVRAAAMRPKGLAYSQGESLVSMAPALFAASGGAAAGTAIGSGIGTVVEPGGGTVVGGAGGAAIGSVVGLASGTFLGMLPITVGQKINSELTKRGYDVTNADDLQRAYSDPKVMAVVKGVAEREGLTVSAVNALLSSVGGKFLGKAEASGAGALAKVGAASADIGIQAGGQAVADVAGQVAANKSTKNIDVGQSLQTGIAMLGYGFGQEAIGMSRRAYLHHDVAQAAMETQAHADAALKAQHDVKALQEIGAAIKDAPSTAAVPDRVKSLIETATGGTDAAAVHFDPTEWDHYWQSKGASPAKAASDIMGDAGKAYYEAKATDAPLKVPLGDYVSKVAPTEHFEGLLPITRTSADGMSLGEASDYLQSLPSTMQELATEATSTPAQPDVADQPARSAAEVGKTIQNALIEAGRPTSEAKAQASLYASVFHTLGQRTQIDPLELFQRYAMRINMGEDLDPRKLTQEYQQALPTSRMAVLHNLTGENLQFADKVGGLAVPSLGVVPEGQSLSGFGDITLLGKAHLGDPTQVPIHDADVYSARFPKAEYNKAKTADAQALVNKLRPFEKRFGDRGVIDSMWDNAVNRPNPEESIQQMLRSNAVQAAFLAEKGTHIEPVMKPADLEAPFVEMPAFKKFEQDIGYDMNRSFHDHGYWKQLGTAISKAIDEYAAKYKDEYPGYARLLKKSYLEADGKASFGKMIGLERSMQNRGTEQVDLQQTEPLIQNALKGHEAEFKQWVEQQILSMHSAPFMRLRGKKVPYTLANMVEAMSSSRIRGKEKALTFGEGAARAHAAERFTSIEEMRKALPNVADAHEIDDARKDAQTKMDAYRMSVVEHYQGYGGTWEALDASMRAMAQWAKGAQTEARLAQALRREGFVDVPPEAIQQGMEAGTAFMRAPVPYFEAKPQRAVALNEFAGAVVPERAATPEVLDVLQRHGIQAKVVPGELTDQGRSQAVSQLQQELHHAGQSVFFQSTPQLPAGFFSKAESIVEQKMGTSATVEQVQGMLKDIKGEERKWLGLDDFLADKEKVTKEELLDFMRGNRLNIEETEPAPEGSQIDEHAVTHYINHEIEQRATQAVFRELGTEDEWNEEGGKRDQGFGTYRDIFPEVQREYIEEMSGNRDTMQELREEAIDHLGFSEAPSEGRYAEYKLPGGEDYQELLFTLPDLPGRAYQTGHFDESNIFAHTRFDTRVDAQGRKTLFLEEIQSDLHQVGREKGYKPELAQKAEQTVLELESAQKAFKDAAQQFVDTHPQFPWTGNEHVNINNALYYSDQIGDKSVHDAYTKLKESQDTAEKTAEAERHAVPDAPFRNTWHEFVLKRMIRYAAEHGYEAIGWTTGDTQNERYSLEKTVNGITYNPETGALSTRPPGNEGYRMIGTYKPEELQSVVGKEAAVKLMTTELNEFGVHKLEGDELKVGGEGMKGFYDNIIPKFLNKFGKKFGTQVEQTTVPTGVPEGTSQIPYSAKFVEPGDVEAVHSLPISDELRDAALNQGFELFQNNTPEGPRGRFAINQATRETAISLFQSADRSTFLHESAHFYLEVMQDLENENVDMKSDMTTVREWLGAKEDAPLTVEQHEQFARGFEQYLMEGKAPSTALADTFYRFKTWLTKIYRSVANLNVPMNDEIRGVFSRLLASEDEIREAETREHVTPLFENPTEVGMNADQALSYTKAVREAHQSAETELTTKMMQELRKEESAEWKAWRAPIRDEIEQQVNQMPDQIATSLLRKGVMPDGTAAPEGFPEGLKLSRTAVRAQFDGGEELVEQLKDLTTGKLGGIHPNVAAEMFGYKNGEALLQALAQAPKRGELINQMTDARMQAEHGERMTDDQVRQQAIASVRGEQRVQLLRKELQYLASDHLAQLKGLVKTITKKIPPTDEIKLQAAKIIGEKAISDISPRSYELAAAKAAAQAKDALLRGDVEAAFEAKRRELLTTEVFRAAQDARDAVEGSLEKFKKLFVADDKIVKTRDMDLVNAGRAILATYGLGKSEKPAAAYLEQLRHYDPTAFDAMQEMVNQATTVQGNYQALTYNDFTDLAENIGAIWTLARRVRQVEIDGQLLDRDTIKAALTERLEALTPTAKDDYERSASKWEKTKLGLMGAKAALTRVEHWARAMDAGAHDGVFRKYIWNPVSEGATAYRVAREAVLAKYLDIVKGVEGQMTKGVIPAPELGYEFRGKAELLGAMLHTGNESNLSKLLRGRSWGTVDDNDVLDTSRWDSFVKRMQQEGKLTKADYDYLQNTWDLFDELKVGAQHAHKAMYGRYFNEITAQSFDTPYGTYRGGYTPAKVDPFVNTDTAIRNAKEELLGSPNSFMFPTGGRGFTKSRVEGYAEPLIMDASFVPSHLDAVLKFTHIEPRVRDIARVITSKGMQGPLDAFDKTVRGELLTPWLQRAAQQRIDTPSSGWGGKAADTFFREMRTRSGMQILSANVVVGALQLGHFPAAALRVEPGRLASALWRFVRAPGDVADMVNEKSDYMRTRSTAGMMEVRKAIDDLMLDPSTYEKARAFTAQHGQFLTHGIQNILDHITWSGAYDQAIEQGLTEKESIREADGAVRQTQGSFAAEDISGFEASTPMVKFMSMFYSFFNNKANLLSSDVISTMRSLGLREGAGKLMYIYTLGFMLPSVMAGAIRQATSGQPFVDDDGLPLDVLKLFFESQLEMATKAVPIVGPVVQGTVDWFKHKDPADDIGTSPAIKAIESTVKAPADVYRSIRDKEIKTSEIRDVLTALGLVSGLPVAPLAKPLGYMHDLSTGKATPSGPLDMTRGLLTGQAGGH